MIYDHLNHMSIIPIHFISYFRLWTRTSFGTKELLKMLWGYHQIYFFPEELLLGPDQVKAINSEAGTTLIIGEAGTGKTLVLLAVLFKYSGKHVNEKKLRRVIFLIPKSKIHFRKDVELFIEKYCQKDWIQIRDFTDQFLCCRDNIYLMDEFYDSTDGELPLIRSEAKCEWSPWVLVLKLCLTHCVLAALKLSTWESYTDQIRWYPNCVQKLADWITRTELKQMTSFQSEFLGNLSEASWDAKTGK